jgi:hypothetical protein
VIRALIKAIARGRVWFEELATGRARSLHELAIRGGFTRRYIPRLVNVAFLSPQLVEAILPGCQLFSTMPGSELWPYLNQPDNIVRMETATSFSLGPGHETRARPGLRAGRQRNAVRRRHYGLLQRPGALP